MANLAAILAHCNNRASEIIVGSTSHIALWEGGGAANLGGVHTRQILEDEDAKMSVNDIQDNVFPDTDDHFARTTLLCLENTQNMLGGVTLSPEYMAKMGILARDLNLKSHLDGARLFNAAVAQNTNVRHLCKDIDSVSICFSKGLGAPVGSVLCGNKEFIRLAKRARKRLGGGMRQSGVMAKMCLFALEKNVDRLAKDHENAKMISSELKQNDFFLPRNGQIDTNILYFGLPKSCKIGKEEFQMRLQDDYGVKLTGGYSQGGKLFRLVTHKGVNKEQCHQAIKAILELSSI
jgi:threonine aldolase